MTLTKIASTGVEDSLRWVLGANGTSDYTFTGPGLTGTVNDPTIYLTRGHTYIFQNNSGGHPFYIKTSIANGGTNDAYNTGVTNNGGGNGTEIVFTVPHDSPDILYYQCSSHASMAGQFNIAGSVADGSITTAKLAAGAVTAAKIANDTITATQLATAAVNTGSIGGGAVTTAKIADSAITNVKLNNNSITTAKINDSQITTAKLQDNAVTTAKINPSAVTTAKIADQAVTLAKLEHGTSSNDGKFLRANNGADPTFETVTGTTINGNTDHNVITGTGTANTLQGESTFTHNPSTYDTKIQHNVNTSADLIIQNDNSGTAAGARITLQSGSNSNTGPQFGMICGSDNWYLQTPKTVGALDFHKNGTRTFRLKGDGDVEISDGDLVIGTSGHGIDFSATGNSGGTMQNELLDDYEEGTWSPQVHTQNGQTNATYHYQQGYYTKIGRVVHVSFYIHWSGATNHNGYIYFNNLPFTSSSMSHNNACGSVMLHSATFPSGYTDVVLYMGSNTNGTNLYYSKSGSGWAAGQNTNMGEIIASLTYKAT